MLKLVLVGLAGWFLIRAGSKKTPPPPAVVVNPPAPMQALW